METTDAPNILEGFSVSLSSDDEKRAADLMLKFQAALGHFVRTGKINSVERLLWQSRTYAEWSQWETLELASNIETLLRMYGGIILQYYRWKYGTVENPWRVPKELSKWDLTPLEVGLQETRALLQQIPNLALSTDAAKQLMDATIIRKGLMQAQAYITWPVDHFRRPTAANRSIDLPRIPIIVNLTVLKIASRHGSYPVPPPFQVVPELRFKDKLWDQMNAQTVVPLLP